MKITYVPLTGPCSTIVGKWVLEHGNSAVFEVKELELTEEQLQTVAMVHETLKRAITRNRELGTEEYMDQILAKHKVEEIDWCYDVVRTDAVFNSLAAQIVSFSAIKYDDAGIPHQVLFNGMKSI